MPVSGLAARADGTSAELPEFGRFGYINWLWYGWGAVMINQYKDTDIKIYGDHSVLEYYSLDGISEWAFLGYSALTFVFFFMVAWIVSPFCPLL